MKRRDPLTTHARTFCQGLPKNHAQGYGIDSGSSRAAREKKPKENDEQSNGKAEKVKRLK
ncbi:hypothetical protein DDZ15_15475 [Rhodohalobacter mucosus]|uniref:Uncharacterized protein n=1 Tax=Rhodohalobacter mucosus TaxID=2079485 RepID=A0A316TLK3_9BACT|nr:hypothetical protein DDZ15_15475 [Rhodohalobacter mucosus]